MRLRDEDGQAMILALGFLIFFGLVVTAMLTFGTASVLATQRLREQRGIVYAADGATDGAIQFGRTDESFGAFGNPCPPFSATFNQQSGSVTATVTCKSLATPENLDRKVEITTSVDGVNRIVATVLYHDNSAGTCVQQPCIDVLSWTYLR